MTSPWTNWKGDVVFRAGLDVVDMTIYVPYQKKYPNVVPKPVLSNQYDYHHKGSPIVCIG